MSERRPISALPPTQSLRQLRRMRSARVDMLGHFAEERRDLVRMSFVFGSVLLVNHPELVHEVLVSSAKSFEKSPIMRSALHPLAGQGLFTSEGDLWRRQRKLMAPMFQHQALRPFAEPMVACAEQGVRELADGAVVDIARETTRITMAIAGRTLFSVDTFGEADELGAALTVALDWAGTQSASLPLILQARSGIALGKLADRLPAPLGAPLEALAQRTIKPILWPTEVNRELKRALAVLERRVATMTAARGDASAGAGPRDLLGLLLAARDDEGNPMPERQVRDEVLTLFVAGHETTATALAWALMLVAQHPEVYARLRDEVDALPGRPAFEDLPRLAYATRVFKESMRILPPVYVFGRVSTAPVELGDYLVPKGTVTLISPYALHHRPDVWPTPRRFDPDRFLPEEEAKRHKTAYIPFSAGPRTCIGNYFALMEGPLVLATLLRHADFELLDPRGAQPDPQATLRPRGGIPMRVRLRRR